PRPRAAHPLDLREERADALGELALHRVRRAERQAAARHALDRGKHVRMRMAGDHRSPRPEVVDVAAALDVPHVRAVGAVDEARRAADRAERPHGRVDAADEDLAGAFEFREVGAHAGTGYPGNGRSRQVYWMPRRPVTTDAPGSRPPHRPALAPSGAART